MQRNTIQNPKGRGKKPKQKKAKPANVNVPSTAAGVDDGGNDGLAMDCSDVDSDGDFPSGPSTEMGGSEAADAEFANKAVFEDKMGDLITALTENKKKGRDVTLSEFRRLLQMRCCPELLVGHTFGIVDSLVDFVKKAGSTEAEKRDATRALAICIMQLINYDGVDLGQHYTTLSVNDLYTGQIRGPLLAALTGASVSTQCYVAECLAMACFLCAADPGEIQYVMSVLYQTFVDATRHTIVREGDVAAVEAAATTSATSGSAKTSSVSISQHQMAAGQLATSALAGWALLSTCVSMPNPDQCINRFVTCLESPILDLRLQAGICIALIYESRSVEEESSGINEYEDSDDSSEDINGAAQIAAENGIVTNGQRLAYNHSQHELLCRLLKGLSTDSRKHVAKKDRKLQRASFRDIFQYVEGRGLDIVKVKLGACGGDGSGDVLVIHSWTDRLIYDSFTSLLGSGMRHHLRENPFLRQSIFGLPQFDVASQSNALSGLGGLSRKQQCTAFRANAIRRKAVRNQARRKRIISVSQLQPDR